MNKKKWIESWNRKKEKKARFKRKLRRIRKRGGLIYGGFVPITDALDNYWEDANEQKASAEGSRTDN